MLNWNVPANTNDDVAIASRPPWLQTLRHRRCWWRWWWFKRGFSGHAWKVRCRDNVPKWWLLCYSLLVTCKLPSTHWDQHTGMCAWVMVATLKAVEEWWLTKILWNSASWFSVKPMPKNITPNPDNGGVHLVLPEAQMHPTTFPRVGSWVRYLSGKKPGLRTHQLTVLFRLSRS